MKKKKEHFGPNVSEDEQMKQGKVQNRLELVVAHHCAFVPSN